MWKNQEPFCAARGHITCMFICRTIWQDFVKSSILIPSATAFLVPSLYPREVLPRTPDGPAPSGSSSVWGFPGMRGHENRNKFVKCVSRAQWNTVQQEGDGKQGASWTYSNRDTMLKRGRNVTEHNIVNARFLKQRAALYVSHRRAYQETYRKSFGKI